jgi:hypothetical protein
MLDKDNEHDSLEDYTEQPLWHLYQKNVSNMDHTQHGMTAGLITEINSYGNGHSLH